MDRVLPEPVSPPVELLLLFRRCPRRGERGRRGERPGLPDTDPFPLDPTTSSFEMERELPYMVREYGVYTAVTKELMLIQMNKSSESKIHPQNYTKTKISKSKKM